MDLVNLVKSIWLIGFVWFLFLLKKRQTTEEYYYFDNKIPITSFIIFLP